MVKLTQKQTGFTIVELLIVIVVIGILAAISIVAYNGVTQRANNQRIATAVRTYQKALIAYATDYHAYPGDHYCLGLNYPSGQCWNGANGTYATNSSVDAALAPYLNNGSPIFVSNKVLQITSVPDYRLGILLVATSPTYKLTYYLEGGGQTCIDGSGGGTEMQGTQCQLPLPNPTNL